MSRSSLSKTINFFDWGGKAWEKFVEEVQSETPKQRKHHSRHVKILKTLVWLQSLFSGYGLSKAEICDWVSYDSQANNTVDKWLSGQMVASPFKVEQINNNHKEGSDYFFVLPLFKLLMNTPLSKAKLNIIIAPYIAEDRFLKRLMWNLPEKRNDLDSGEQVISIFGVPGEEMLLDRFDLYGLTGLIYLMRIAEAEKDTVAHLEFAKRALRVLPGACRHPFFKPHWPKLFLALNDVINRVPSTFKVIQPRPAVIQSHIAISRIEFHRHPGTKTKRKEWAELPYSSSSFGTGYIW